MRRQSIGSSLHDRRNWEWRSPPIRWPIGAITTRHSELSQCRIGDDVHTPSTTAGFKFSSKLFLSQVHPMTKDKFYIRDLQLRGPGLVIALRMPGLLDKDGANAVGRDARRAR